MHCQEFIVYCALDEFCDFFEIWNKLIFHMDIYNQTVSKNVQY